MMRMAARLGSSLLISLMLVVVTGRDARADSDGHFCVGAGFIAVEFRAFNTHGLSGSHVLRIARFDAEKGPRWTGEVVVEEFQTHTLSCGAKTIIFEGVGERGRGLVSYVVQVDTSGAPRIVSRASDPGYSFRAFPAAPGNIGNWALPGVTPLPNAGGYPRFQLRVTRTDRRVDGGIRHDMKSVLEEIDRSGQVRRSLLVNEGTLFESGGA